MLKVGVIGLGTVSVVHLRGIQESPIATLQAICDIDSQKSMIEEVPFYTNYQEMIEEEALDLVHVCLPHYLHEEVSYYCAQKGVHVFLEKPVTTDYQSSLRLTRKVNALENKVKVAVCFQNRMNNSVEKLKNILEKNESESVIAVKGLVPWFRPSTYYTEKPWRGTWKEAGSGVLINQAIHTLDLMGYIIGKDWVETKASVAKLLDYEIEVEDTASANILYQDKIHGLFFATNAYYGNDSIELQVVTNKTSYTIRNNKLLDKDFNCLVEDDSLPSSKIYYGPGHQKCMEAFYQAVLNDTDKYCSLEDALSTMDLVDAIKESSDRNSIIHRKED